MRDLTKANVFKTEYVGWNLVRPQIPGAGWLVSIHDTWEEAYRLGYEAMDSPEAHLVLELANGSL